MEINSKESEQTNNQHNHRSSLEPANKEGN